MSDSSNTVFWASVRMLASTFRHQDPLLSGRLRQAASYFKDLPEDEQIELRDDVQLLTVQLAKLALAMTIQLDEEGQESHSN